MPRTLREGIAGLALFGAVCSAVPAQADANGGIAAAMALTAADGSVRTQAGVRLAISPVAGAPDRVVAMSGALSARMPDVRACLATSLTRATRSDGSAVYEVEAGARGAAKVKLVRDDTGDAELAACMRSALTKARFVRVQRGARAEVALHVHNPLAVLQKQARAQATTQEVRMLAGGRAESAGGTEDITFRVRGAARAAPTIAHVARDMTTHVAGLLDCRRKAFRREREQAGSITLDVTLRGGELAQTRPRSTVKPSASRCVSAWLEQLDARTLPDAELELAFHFAEAR